MQAAREFVGIGGHAVGDVLAEAIVEILPSLALGDAVVFGHGEEVETAMAIPFGDDFGEFIAIAPEGMDVGCTFEPLCCVV